MRKYIIPTITCVLILLGCSQKSKYEQLISDYVQTDSRGVKTDVQLQILEIKELPPVTVKDSTELLKAEFEKKKHKQIESANNLLQLSQQTLDKEKKSRIKLQMIIDQSQKNIERAQIIIDSLQAIRYVNKFGDEPQNKILSQPVQCRYSYIYPKDHPRQEIEEILYITPDISKITGRKRIKK